MAQQPVSEKQADVAPSPTAPGQDESLLLESSILERAKSLHGELSARFGWSSGKDLGPFLKDVQKLPDEDYKHLLAQNEGKSSFEVLMAYLTSPYANIQRQLPKVDLSYALPNYFISSSHNTYLTGNQLSSISSTDGYKGVLVRGCRCVEIDVWNGKGASKEDDEHGTGEEKHGLREKLGLKKKTSTDAGPKEENSKSEAGEQLGIAKRIAQHLKPGKPSNEADTLEKSESADLGSLHASSSRGSIEPRVLHGHTMTREIAFRDVCKAIRDVSFLNSDLPVIVSFEVHTNLEQQMKMVEIIESEWEGLLVHDKALENDQTSPSSPLPAPQNLKNKILIKVKYTSPQKAKKRLNEAAQKDNHDESSSSSDEDSHEKKQSAKPKTLDALSRLGVYTRAYHFKSFDQPEAKIPNHVFSLGESALTEAQGSSGTKLFDHNKTFLMRAYPKGLRLDSSNLDPSLFWRQGVQMVALNWQSIDKGTMLNEAMFSGTGGYVLKPAYFRGDQNMTAATATVDSSTKPAQQPQKNNAEGNVEMHGPSRKLTLSIDFLAAQNIPYSQTKGHGKGFKPYVKCIFHNETLDQKKSKSKEEKKRHKSKLETRRHSGPSPDFGGETIKFEEMVVDDESLCFVRFKVMDDIDMARDPLAAWAAIRLDRVQEGLRLVALFDAKGGASKGLLLVRITKMWN